MLFGPGESETSKRASDGWIWQLVYFSNLFIYLTCVCSLTSGLAYLFILLPLIVGGILKCLYEWPTLQSLCGGLSFGTCTDRVSGYCKIQLAIEFLILFFGGELYCMP